MQANPTQLTSTKIQMLLDYLHTYPNARVCFYASDMQLRIDSNAAYLVAPKAKSRIAGFFYCSDKPTTTKPVPKHNGLIHVKCRTLQHVVTSAAEAETAALFFSTQTALEIGAFYKHSDTINATYQSRWTIRQPHLLSTIH